VTPNVPKSKTRRLAIRLADAIKNRVYRYAPEFGRRWWDGYQNDMRISRSPDRHVLQKSIFPGIADVLASKQSATILWIGCARYTKHYYEALERRGAKCWTMDIDPDVYRWGRRGRHVTGDLCSVARLLPAQYFDVIFCNGIFGFGIDTLDAQSSAAAAMASVMKPDGWLVLGWNTGKVADPIAQGTVSPWFEPAVLADFGTRKFVGGCTHVFDLLRLRGDGFGTPPDTAVRAVGYAPS
jgi:hypothetical protein